MTLCDYLFANYEYIISVDSEFRIIAGGTPAVVCFVYQDLKTGEVWDCTKPEDILNLPFPHDEAVYIVFNAVAEGNAWLAWNIPLPEFVIDLYVEYKNLVQDGVGREKGFFSMLSACRRLGVEAKYITSEEEKELWRDLIINQTNYTDKELRGIVRYCRADVIMTGKLLPLILKHIEIRLSYAEHETRLMQILLRGRGKLLESQVIHYGIAVDNDKLNLFNEHWPQAKENFIKKQDKGLNCFEDGVFKQEKFKALIIKNNLFDKFPRTAKGNLKSDEKTLELYDSYPDLNKLRKLRKIAGSGKMLGYNIGPDNRSRTELHWFSTVTGRTAASSSKYPFGPSKWVRELIKPPTGFTYAYIDYRHQEPCIQAYLSRDQNLIQAVESGDIYISTAKLSKAVPDTATKQSHPEERGKFKIGFLMNGYGAGSQSMAIKLKGSNLEAKEVQSSIKRAYATYFKWSGERVNIIRKQGRLQTKFGWTRHMPATETPTTNSLANWPIQATGAEMTRLWMILLLDAGIEVHATVHDAVLILVPNKDRETRIALAQELGADAAELVVDKRIGTEVEIIEGNWKQPRTPNGDGDGDLFDSIFEEIEKIANGK